MKRITIKTITLLAAALSLAACSKDEHNAPDSAQQVEITTRLSAQNDGGSAITPGGDTAPVYAPTVGTEIALYYAHVGNAQNALFRYDADGNWQCTRQLFWDHLDPPAGADHFPFFAASPQTPDAQPAVIANQNDADAYRLSDQLFAYTTAANRRERLDLNFRHVLAQLKIELESPAGDDQLDLSQVTLRVTGARLAYTLAYTGTAPSTASDAPAAPSESTPAIATANADATPADLIPRTMTRTSGTSADAARASFLAILPPQTASLKFIFTVAGKTYTYDDAKNALFAAGRNTSYKLTISKSDLALAGITLEPWDDSRPATEASIRADLTGDAPTPGTEAETIAGTAMNIWKRTSADASADQANAHLYNKVGNAWLSPSPIYVDDTQTDDRFYATIANATDATTGTPDLIAAGPARMGQGMIALGFTHLMAQLAINVKPGADFPAGIDLTDATVRTPALQSAYTLTYSADDANAALEVAPATDDATRRPLTGLQTGVADADAAAAKGETLYLVVPQTLPAGSAFTVTLGSKTYTGTLAAAMPLAPGGKNVLTLTLSATQMTIGAITLQPWAQGANGSGSANADGIKDIATALSGIDQAGTLYLAATDPDAGTVATGGLGIYPLEIGADGSAVSSDLSRAILWDNLADGDYIYRALYAPAAYRHGATDEDNHERDYLTATSAATPWGTAPSFSASKHALKHATAQLTVSLSSNDGSFGPTELAGAGITTFSLRSADPDADRATLAFTKLDAEKAVRLRPAASNRPAAKTALIAPQTLTRVVIAIGDKTYTLTRALELSANATSTLEVNVQRTALGFTVSVTDWNTQDTIHGGDVSVDD